MPWLAIFSSATNIYYPPPSTQTPKQNLWISFYPKDLGSCWVLRSSEICLLPQFQFLLHQKWIRIGWTASIFRRWSGVRVLGNNSGSDCRPHSTLPSQSNGLKLCMVRVIPMAYYVHTDKVQESPRGLVWDMQILAMNPGNWNIKLASIAGTFDLLW